jgi:NAD(P)-dependent dehydrogenase (short-subunit alcohol dehydrogenase family)
LIVSALISKVAVVVGASGVLAPFARGLVGSGWKVVGVGRHRDRLEALAAEVEGSFLAIAADATVDDFLPRLTGAIVGSRVEAAVVYEPAISAENLERLVELTTGRVVVVCTSRTAAPTDSAEEAWSLAELTVSPESVNRLVLGWHREPARWHDAAEISAAAADVFRNGEDAVLGVLRPWTERPA